MDHLCDTTIFSTLIIKYPFEYEDLLGNISDFLVCENIWKKSEQDVEFQDSLVIKKRCSSLPFIYLTRGNGICQLMLAGNFEISLQNSSI